VLHAAILAVRNTAARLRELGVAGILVFASFLTLRSSLVGSRHLTMTPNVFLRVLGLLSRIDSGHSRFGGHGIGGSKGWAAPVARNKQQNR
jgi:hypothetical protein